MSTFHQPASTSWASSQARAQFLAIVRLRWRIFVNGFRRKNQTGEIIARIIIYPIVFSFTLLPTVGSGIAAWFFASQHDMLRRVGLLLWGTFVLCQLLNIQLGTPGTTFDPTQLIRFPMRRRQYVLVRLFFGLLTPANVIGTLMSVAIATGITIALPAVWLPVWFAMAVFAATNILFSRMIFAWVDRWLSTRRAREIFTGFIFLFSIGIQWLNFTYNPAYNRHSTGQGRVAFAGLIAVYHRIYPYIRPLPPELTIRAIIAATWHNYADFLRLTAICAMYAAAFLYVFAWRMNTEYSGENLSDNATMTPAAARTARTSTRRYELRYTGPVLFSSYTRAQLVKEFRLMLRNMGILYGVVMPVLFVLLFSSKLAVRFTDNSFLFPAAAAYTMLGLLPMAYNSLGQDGAGAQLYVLAPVRMRHVMLGKNLLQFSLAAVEIAVTFSIIAAVATPPPFPLTLFTVLWAYATVLVSTVVGNRRSITAPKRVSSVRMANKQASPLSALLSMGLLVLSSAIGFGVYVGCALLNQKTIADLVAAAFAVAASWFYIYSLNRLDALLLDHREPLFTELSKAD